MAVKSKKIQPRKQKKNTKKDTKKKRGGKVEKPVKLETLPNLTEGKWVVAANVDGVISLLNTENNFVPEHGGTAKVFQSEAEANTALDGIAAFEVDDHLSHIARPVPASNYFATSYNFFFDESESRMLLSATMVPHGEETTYKKAKVEALKALVAQARATHKAWVATDKALNGFKKKWS